MSWNVHGLRGGDGRRDPDRIRRVIEEADADVVALQELEAAPGAPNPAVELAAPLGLQSAFGQTRTHRGHPYGNGVLSRQPIEATRNYDLSVRGHEPRGCLRADVRVGDARIHFFAAHLGLSGRERRRQAALLLSADVLRDTALSYPLVLAGDFNAWSRRSAVPRWLRRQLVDCAHAARAERATFPAWFPVLRLDLAYVDAAFRVLGCEVVRTPLARRASDHLPLLVELELLPSASRPPVARDLDTAGVTTTVRER